MRSLAWVGVVVGGAATGYEMFLWTPTVLIFLMGLALLMASGLWLLSDALQHMTDSELEEIEDRREWE